ncbi:hypothetical protein GNP06_03505 [Pseudomonas sp. TDA1]|nr:hypothetical protein [Pseudomonas sp. TDA1]
MVKSSGSYTRYSLGIDRIFRIFQSQSSQISEKRWRKFIDQQKARREALFDLARSLDRPSLGAKHRLG